VEPLEAIEIELNDATERARRLVEQVDGRRFTVRPDPTRWSAAECIAHLSLSAEEMLPVIREAIDKAPRAAKRRKVKMDWLGALLRWFLEPPVRSRVKTPARFVPRSVRAKAETLAEFTAFQQKLIDVLHDARDVDLTGVRVVSPFDRRVKYNLYSAFRVLAAHERRHLWQAEQAVAALSAAA
jgi:DinB family protein